MVAIFFLNRARTKRNWAAERLLKNYLQTIYNILLLPSKGIHDDCGLIVLKGTELIEAVGLWCPIEDALTMDR